MRVCYAQFTRWKEHTAIVVGMAFVARDSYPQTSVDPAIAPTLQTRAHDAAAFVEQMQTLNAAGRHDEAQACAQAWIAAHPDAAFGWIALSEALMGAGKAHGAIAAAQRALTLSPDNGAAQITLAQGLRALGRYREAVSAARLAYVQRGGDHKALLCLSMCLAAHGDCAEALALGLRARAETGGWEAEIAVMRSAFFLGRYDLAWAAAEARHLNDVPLPKVPGARWRGEDVTGKTIVLVGEQGLGDSIQFARYAWALRARGATVILHLQEALEPLFTRLPQGISFAASFDLRAMDYWSPLLSAPLYLNMLEPMAPPSAYISAPAAIPVHTQPERAREVLGFGPKVGIVWAGNPQHRGDALRSIALPMLAPIFEANHARFFSLQVGPARAQLVSLGYDAMVHDLGVQLGDWGQTAATIAALDLVITVDTAVAHLAGAMNIPVWMLTPYCPDWRWTFSGQTTPWYPSMRLYRQPREGDWRTPIDAIACDLAGLRFGARHTARSA